MTFQGLEEDMEALLSIAVIDLIIESPHWGDVKRKVDSLPETMLFEQHRINALTARFHNNVLSSVILLTVEEEYKKLGMDAATTSLVTSVREIVLNNLSIPGGTSSATIKLVMDDLYNKNGMIMEQLDHTEVTF
jgi:hypothetical protein